MRMWFLPLLAACASAPVAPVVAETKGEGYVLFEPVPPEPGRAAVILLHGFARSPGRMAGHARALANEGFVVVTPKLESLLGGAKARESNVARTVGRMRWLVAEKGVDPARIGLAGHSAGGAIALMAAVRAQEEGLFPAALCLLDAVPWEETIEAARRLRPLPLLSLTADPSPMNANGRIAELHAALAVPFTHTPIPGSSHVDPENPPDFLARAFSTEEGRKRYADLLVAFFSAELR